MLARFSALRLFASAALARILLYGFVSAGVAWGLLYGFLRYGERHIPQLVSLQVPLDLFLIALFLTTTGMFTTYVSTWRAMRKYLRMSLDDLY